MTGVVERIGEVAVAAAAARLRTTEGHAVGPEVAGENAGRPVLAHVPGPRLDVLVQEAGEPEAALHRTGRALAALHEAEPPAGLDPVQAETPPWEPLTASTWLGLTQVQRRLVGVLHSDADLRARGRRTRDWLRAGTVWCHGDARTSNICLTPEGQPRLVDWEAAGLGRAETDVGALCGALLTDTLLAVREPAGPAARTGLRAAVALAAHRIRLVLAGYRADRRQPLDNALLAATVGTALLTRAFMRASATRWDRVVMAQYELGRGLVLDPRRWRVIDHAA